MLHAPLPFANLLGGCVGGCVGWVGGFRGLGWVALGCGGEGGWRVALEQKCSLHCVEAPDVFP